MLKYTQLEVATKIGITDGALRSLEAGRSAPRNETLQRLTEVLHCSADYILFGVMDEDAPAESPTQTGA